MEPHGGCPNIQMAHSLATVHRGRVPVRVRNVQPHPVTIHRHQGLAQVTTVVIHKVREGRDIHCTLVSPGVVEVWVVEVGLEVDVEAVEVPVQLLGESLQGDGLDAGQQQQLQ